MNSLGKGTDRDNWIIQNEQRILHIGQGYGRVNMQVVWKYEEEGLLRKEEHPDLPIAVYKYNQNHSFTPTTRFLRGTVLTHNGFVLSRPFEKFFNYSKWEKKLDNFPPKNDPVVMEKMDGSMITAFFYKGKWRVASSGSFIGPHAEKAREMLEDLDTSQMMQKYTYVFEMVSSDPKFQVVKRYDEDELVLLAVRHRVNGEIRDPHNLKEIADRINTRTPKFYNKSLQETLDEIDYLPPEFEGYVLWWPESRLRAKLKGEAYRKKHSYTQTSKSEELHVAEHLTPGGEVDLDDESLEDVILKIEEEFADKWNDIQHAHQMAKERDTRKEQAKYLDWYRDEYEKHAVFALLDGDKERAEDILIDHIKRQYS